MRPAQRVLYAFECLSPSALDEALNAYEVGRETGLRQGAERERRAWEARMQALRELAEQAEKDVEIVPHLSVEPVDLTADEHATFAEIAFQERVRQLLEDDDPDDDEPRGWIP